MSILEAIVLGIVQGLTEFLPISSTAHLRIVPALFGSSGIVGGAERADWVAGFISAHGLSEAFQLLGVCAVPWSEPLGRAVEAALRRGRFGSVHG